MRKVIKQRETNETSIKITLDLDGCGNNKIATDFSFFNHMLEQFAYHSNFDLEIEAISKDKDQHHLVEDVAITLGKAIDEALQDRKGISRYGETTLPMDETLIQAVVDISGRAFSKVSINLKDERTSDFETVMLPHFFSALAQNALMTIHIRELDGFDTHHKIEATFKSFARALKQAVAIKEENKNVIPSTKGVL